MKPGIARPRVCTACVNTDHAHYFKVRVGPYIICRCLWCPTVVVGLA